MIQRPYLWRIPWRTSKCCRSDRLDVGLSTWRLNFFLYFLSPFSVWIHLYSRTPAPLQGFRRLNQGQAKMQRKVFIMVNWYYHRVVLDTLLRWKSKKKKIKVSHRCNEFRGQYWWIGDSLIVSLPRRKLGLRKVVKNSFPRSKMY